MKTGDTLTMELDLEKKTEHGRIASYRYNKSKRI